MIVEDEANVLSTVSEALRRNGYEPVPAGGGREALEIARQGKPDVVVTDLAMPQFSGLDLIRALRDDEELRYVPVIVITARDDRDSMRDCMDIGADDFLGKPFTQEELVHSIEARLDKKELLDELDSFAHTVAHDLRSPLATLSGRVELAQMVVDSGDLAKVKHNLDELHVGVGRLTKIVDEILLLAGLRRDVVEPAPFDPEATIVESLQRIDGVLKKFGAEVLLPGAWPLAVGYAPWVTHVWANLLSNAAKYGGESPRIEVRAAVSEDGDRVRFEVRDQGPGLDPVVRERLFTAFTNLPAQRRKGHGLGLSIVQRIVSKLNGRLGVESELGRGATFWFELPAAK